MLRIARTLSELCEMIKSELCEMYTFFCNYVAKVIRLFDKKHVLFNRKIFMQVRAFERYTPLRKVPVLKRSVTDERFSVASPCYALLLERSG